MLLQRQALSPIERTQKARALDILLATHPVFLKSRRIAAYCAHLGEIDPQFILKRAWAMGKSCFLPVLHPVRKHHLWFVEYGPQDTLLPNRWGVLEPPQGKNPVPAWSLDLVLVPTVAFDEAAHRLGMGLGYYDRTFAFLKDRVMLLGLAYEFQGVQTLPVDIWDIPLAGVATEKRIVARCL